MSIILLEIPYKNELIKYKLNIDMDSTKLKMHFAIKEKTEFYVHGDNVLCIWCDSLQHPPSYAL